MTNGTPASDRSTRVRDRVAQVRRLAAEHGIDAVVLGTQASVAWLGDGLTNGLLRGRREATVWVLVTADDVVLMATDTERGRLQAEEDVAGLGLRPVYLPWYGPAWIHQVRAQVGDGLLGDDGLGFGLDLSNRIRVLRSRLSPAEAERLAALSTAATRVVQDAATATRPGWPETRLAAAVAGGLADEGVVPLVLLIGSGRRLTAFRHWLPTPTPIEGAVTVTLAAERAGLVTVLSRSVAFDIDPVTVERDRLVRQIAATTISATAPGGTWGSALQAGVRAYAAAGFADHWRVHVQGGAVGYDTREFSPGPHDAPNEFSDVPIELGQAAAWNPTLPGVKSEDTFLVTAAGPQVLTRADDWPTRELETEGGPLVLPDLLRC